MLLLTDDADVRSAAARADDSVAVVPDLDAVRDRFADAHDRLIVASASTHVGRSDLRSLTACTDAVLRSAAIPNGHPPHEMYSIDFPLGDAQPIDGDIDSIRDLVDALSARTHESDDGGPAVRCRSSVGPPRGDRARPRWDRSLHRGNRPSDGGLLRFRRRRTRRTHRRGRGHRGPAFVARNASIGPNAYVRGASYLGKTATSVTA